MQGKQKIEHEVSNPYTSGLRLVASCTIVYDYGSHIEYKGQEALVCLPSSCSTRVCHRSQMLNLCHDEAHNSGKINAN